MIREAFERALKAQEKILDCYDEQRQIIDEQVEENRGLRGDVLLMQKVNAEQRARIEQQAKEIVGLKRRLNEIRSLSICWVYPR